MIAKVDPRFGETRHASGAYRLSVFAEALEGLSIDTMIETLMFGDVAFLGNGPNGPFKIGIELKTIKDLISSMQSKRLQGHQVPGMLETYDRSYLVVEGFFRAGRPSGILEVPAGRKWRQFRFGKRPVFWSDIEEFLTGLEEAGVRVKRTRTPFETSLIIARVLCRWWEKDYDKHSFNVVHTPNVMMPTDDPVTARFRRVLIALKTGIGVGRSTAVAERFRSIHSLVTADVEAWNGLEGIGKTIARKTVEAVREEIGATTHRLSSGARGAYRSPRTSRNHQNHQSKSGTHAE